MKSGSSVYALRYDPDGTLEWKELHLGDAFSTDGASAEIYSLKETTKPALLAKIYKQDFRDLIRASGQVAHRLILLCQHRQALATQLPFAVWPRRLLFSERLTNPNRFASSIVGFTMPQLTGTTSLQRLYRARAARNGLTLEKNLHIALRLIEQIDAFHKHPWRFVFGDLSPNNIHISKDFLSLTFIDIDGIQFDPAVPGIKPFPAMGTTPEYNSPQSTNYSWRNGPTLTHRHDLFLLATHLFTILMGQQGAAMHPYASSDASASEDTRMAARQFPFDQPNPPISKFARNAYANLSPDLRAAFTQVFANHTILSAAQWRDLIRSHWQSLSTPSSSSAPAGIGRHMPTPPFQATVYATPAPSPATPAPSPPKPPTPTPAAAQSPAQPRMAPSCPYPRQAAVASPAAASPPTTGAARPNIITSTPSATWSVTFQNPPKPAQTPAPTVTNPIPPTPSQPPASSPQPVSQPLPLSRAAVLNRLHSGFQRYTAQIPPAVRRLIHYRQIPLLRSLARAWPGFAVGVLATLAAVWYLRSPQPAPAVQLPPPAQPALNPEPTPQLQPTTATLSVQPPEPSPPKTVPAPEPNPHRPDWPYQSRRACHLANAAVTSFGCLEHPVSRRSRIASIYAAARLNQISNFSYRNTDGAMLYGGEQLCRRLTNSPSGTCYPVSLTLADTTFTLYQPMPPSRGVDVAIPTIVIPRYQSPSQPARDRPPDFWGFLFDNR